MDQVPRSDDLSERIALKAPLPSLKVPTSGSSSKPSSSSSKTHRGGTSGVSTGQCVKTNAVRIEEDGGGNEEERRKKEEMRQTVDGQRA